MRFLVDECTGPAVARWLQEQGHDVFSVYDSARGMSDDQVIAQAISGAWILITNDKDFGEKVYHRGQPHHGVVLLRLDDERSPCKIAALRRLLGAHADRLAERFVVVTDRQVRFSRRAR